MFTTVTMSKQRWKSNPKGWVRRAETCSRQRHPAKKGTFQCPFMTLILHLPPLTSSTALGEPRSPEGTFHPIFGRYQRQSRISSRHYINTSALFYRYTDKNNIKCCLKSSGQHISKKKKKNTPGLLMERYLENKYPSHLCHHPR